MSTYTVRRGDTPYLIAQKLCGDGSRQAEMLALNPDFATGETKSGWKMLRTGNDLVVPDDWEAPEVTATVAVVQTTNEAPPGARFEPEITLASPADVYAALDRAWRRVFDGAPTPDALAICVSQWALETGWGKSCFNWNLGNVKSVPKDGLDHVYYPCWEVLSRSAAHATAALAGHREDGKGPNVVIASEDDTAGTAVVWFYPDHPTCRFRAFRSLDEGAEAYLRILSTRFAKAWSVLVLGNPSAFASALKSYDYFSAPLDGPRGYRPVLVSIFNRVQAQLAA